MSPQKILRRVASRRAANGNEIDNEIASVLREIALEIDTEEEIEVRLHESALNDCYDHYGSGE